MRPPYDQDDPPAEPPAGSDPLMWRLAYQVHAEHQPGPDGCCTSRLCRRENRLSPCPPRRLAAVGFAAATGSRTPWSTLNRGHRCPPYENSPPDADQGERA